MSKKIYLGQECEITKLHQFKGYHIQICSGDNLNYVYQNFDYEISLDNNELILKDLEHSDCKSYIPLDKIELIKNINNEDLYRDVIDIFYDGKQISICCDESRPILPHCDYCSEEIEQYEDFFELKARCGYGSIYDGVEHRFLLHWKCFDKQFSNLISKEDLAND